MCTQYTTVLEHVATHFVAGVVVGVALRSQICCFTASTLPRQTFAKDWLSGGSTPGVNVAFVCAALLVVELFCCELAMVYTRPVMCTQLVSHVLPFATVISFWRCTAVPDSSPGCIFCLNRKQLSLVDPGRIYRLNLPLTIY